ncbi:ABC1 kinase family protein [Qipengyuania gaetbuli]|uniref:ABC1 kinase family protein n=1 Tax=Qipengyuania gaetbuli TaxID=266952 RepID=UPI001CD405AB|nr:AarF/ABC1/UbiB kinase family protein [Qipengyuania gaetbuli]MCA0911011.1 AarF/ABC1/UbiB kinase family protein [Qipengyuania gaetbuli]
MADEDKRRARPVPASRLGRLAGFGGLAGGMFAGALGEGARRLAAGERPSMDQLLLTPGNAKRMADKLSHMRGAAMKLGQMISMDAGDALPPELSAILARLREQADFMPPRQLDKVLAEQWGTDWRKLFRRFEPRPIAAASIGQVHRALTRDGRAVAIKVQYPGVAKSIESDVDNVAGLLRMTGLLPDSLDIAPMLAAAKEQLREEADYEREGRMMQVYAELLDGDARFVVPELQPDLTRPHILAMSFEEGRPIEALADEPQDLRDSVFSSFIELVGRELFDFGFMQTDPNFANYRFRADTGQVVLLDFGAARKVDPAVASHYRRLLQAGLDEDRERVREEAVSAGFISPQALARHPERIAKAIDIIVTEMARPGKFDFGDRAFVPEITEEAMPIAKDKQSWHVPPPETLFVQRKVSGTALLGARLKARVDVRSIVGDLLAETAA